jgi:rubrerythrin
VDYLWRSALTVKPAMGKVILEAIGHEIMEREFYLALAKRVKNPLVRRKINGLADDELEHRQTLSRLYWAQTGMEPGKMESSYSGDASVEVEKMSLTELIKIAMEKEKKASMEYRRMASETGDSRTSAFLDYLSDFEMEHFETLAAELARIRSTPGWEDQGPAD